MEYEKVSDKLCEKIIKDKGLKLEKSIRRNMQHDMPTLWRPSYVRDVEKIIHNPFYNRYADKTQVFSFYKNDDISRRALHVQLVSRIARNIGSLLDLNLDLIEAIALGHDLGHTPFGHAGEKFLNEILYSKTGRYFNHNVQSVRVLDGIFHLNISLPVLDGIICHNGEFECEKYKPRPLSGFEEFDKMVSLCYTKDGYANTLVPSTLEGCVVRISDMIAYIGKDRQDAVKTHIIESENVFEDSTIGRYNAAIINNLIVNIIENSYGHDYLLLDEEHFNALKKCKSDNYRIIYLSDTISGKYNNEIKPMFEQIYDKLYKDLENGNESSVIFKHHIDFINNYNKHYNAPKYKEESDNHTIVTDFIASMTDDYFIDLYEYLFPKAKKIEYKSYFYDI